MRRVIALLSVCIAVPLAAPALAASGENEGTGSGPPLLKVGAAERSVLPTVDGGHGYLDNLDYDPTDPWSPGLPIPEWDQGRVAVGNGAASSHWVHDDMKVKAVALEDNRSGRITVVVAANLYMIFRTDGDPIREQVYARLPNRDRDRVDIAIHADHNHHGPDTAFDINHEWYDFMISQVADAVIDAIDNRRPATLSVAEGEHYFGLRDSRDVQVLDPTLGVIQATATNGDVIATLVSWSNHPEVTLFWEPTAEISEDCELIGLEGNECTAEDAYFSADFPGVATRVIEAEFGGIALYLNGAVGALITPLGSNVWEVDDGHPVGDGFTVPDGAVAPGGGDDYTARNFRRTVVLGQELGKAAMALLEEAEPIDSPRISYDTQTMFTRMSNIAFRFLLVPGDNGLTGLGHVPAVLYNCPANGPKTDTTCVADDLQTEEDPILGEIRRGDHTKSVVSYLRIGPVGLMWIPAEIAPELAIGLPADYRDSPENWHHDDPSLHAFGDAYQTAGYVKDLMDDEHTWVVGLGNDELGYVVPLSDFRVFCVADELAGPGTCQALYEAGVIEYPDAIAGATCKAITEDPSLLAEYGPAAEAVAGTCRYGQLLGEAEDHYEETNSVGWDLAADIMSAVETLTGNAGADQVNPEFPGWWAGHTP